MNELSRSQRRNIERTLKDFAFEQSPMFQQNLVQSMSIEQNYGLEDDWEGQLPKDISNRGTQGQFFSPDQTAIELGFEANRVADFDGRRPIYRFAARLVFNTFILPQQVNMPESDWDEVGSDIADYLDEDDSEATMAKAEIVTLLTDNMVSCRKYRRVDYSYDTLERVVHVDDESGYIIAEAPYGVIQTHPEDDPLEYQTTVSDSQIASNLADDKLMNNLVFEETVSELREQYEDYGDIMPHIDKFDEFNYLLQCLKKRYIKLQ